MSPQPISTALLSYGMSGMVFHAPLLKSLPTFKLSTIVQRSIASAKEKWTDITIANRVEDVLQDEAIELIVVNTPNETHFTYASKALMAGKHVVVEKPFTVTSKEADELIAIAKEKNKVITVFQNRRWDGDFLTVKKIINEGLVGKIAEFEVHYDRFRNYIEPNTWKEQSGRGAGILYNLGSHLLDQIIVLFGMPEEADARIGIQREGGRVDDFYDIRLRYPGFYSIVKSSYLVREAGPRFMVHGHDGSFFKYGLDPQEQALKEGKMPNEPGWGTEENSYWGKLNNSKGERKIETIPGNYLEFYQNVYGAIREGKKLEVQPEESRNVIRLIEVCYESNKLRKAIRL